MRLLPRQYGKILYELTKDAKGKELDEITREFMLFLKKEQMMSKINYILDEFTEYAKDQSGIARLKITSARQLSKTELEKITKQFGDKVETELSVDESLLGGVVIKQKNKILDASVRTQLQRLKNHLSEKELSTKKSKN